MQRGRRGRAILTTKLGFHNLGEQHTGTGEFFTALHNAGRQVALIDGHDTYGLNAEAATYWPSMLSIGDITDFSGYDGFNIDVLRQHAAQNPWVNAWQIFNEFEDWKNQADRLIEIMNQYGKEFRFVIFNCSNGKPQYPEEDGEVAYSNIARACKVAKAGGHFFGFHEYGNVWDGNTVLRYRRLMAYLAAHDALCDMVATECGPVEAGTFDEATFMTWAPRYDAELKKDKAVVGCALWTLGGGWYDYHAALPALADYIISLPAPDPEPEPTMFVLGVHATTTPGPIGPGDATGIIAAGKFNGYKFLTGDPPAHYAGIAALGIPPANCLTRLFIDLSHQPKPTPQQFIDGQWLAITEALNSGVTWFELHNEPNDPTLHEWPYSTDPADFTAWALQVVTLLHAANPAIKIVSPGLSPQPNTPAWWSAFASSGLFAACDAIGAHVYWPDDPTMLTPAQGLNFIPLQQYASATKQIFVAEFCNNIGTDADFDKGAQVVRWASYVQAHHPLVTRAYYYVISSGTASDNESRQTIVRGGIVSQIANGIHDTALVVPPVTTDREFAGWLDLDTQQIISTSPAYDLSMTRNYNIRSTTRPKVAPPPITYTCQLSTDGYGAVTGAGTYAANAIAPLRFTL